MTALVKGVALGVTPGLPAKFWDKVDRQEGGCWTWLGYKNNKGYGRMRRGKSLRVVHRVVYEVLVGLVPEGLQLDHLCRNRACVNPEHLEPVTAWVNTMRGNTLQAANAAKTHCPKGHPYSGPNLYIKRGQQRRCRACIAVSDRARNQRAKAKKAANNTEGEQ